MDSVALLLNEIAETLPKSRQALRRLKARAAERAGQPFVRNDALLARYRQDVAAGERAPTAPLERVLTLNGIRSQSGLATVTVITEPYPCPGRCVYCPTEARAPKSYLTNEPAVRRALRHDYDPYRQVQARLEALAQTGHPTDKIELIIKGGTWSFYPESYQETFVRRCLEAANEFDTNCQLPATSSKPQIPTSPLAPEPLSLQLEACSLKLPDGLDEALVRNETAPCRLVGITVETRPDYVTDAEILRLRRLGVTRVELGVQSLEEPVLALIVRDHGTAAVREATRRLKDAGFKVAYHLMPNLPGATPESDLAGFRTLFEDSGYQPDALKLYPCVVVESAELHEWWREGRYQPYDDEILVELLIQMKTATPPYVRLERVIRDIPSTSIVAGCTVTNLREEAQRRMRQRALHCRCIRCRQVRDDAAGEFVLVRRRYPASGGEEHFLSFEDPSSDRLASLLRLRLPADPAIGPPGLPALAGAALIRELHSYGAHLPLSAHRPDAIQHRGFGRQLVREAERIAREEWGVSRIAVIAGVGAREYYRRLGYTLQDTYMVKDLAA